MSAVVPERPESEQSTIWRPPPDVSPLARLCRRRGIALVVLFGSQAKGTSRRDSDVDIGFLPAPGHSVDIDRLFVDLAPLLRSGRLDIVSLQHPPPLLGWAVARDGKPLYEAAPASTWPAYRTRAMKRYQDVRRFEKYWLAELDRFLEDRGALR